MRPTFTGLALRAYWACVFLWVLFFIICLGLGYPTLNRYDPGVLNGDAAQYRAVVMHGSTAASRQVLHRILIPNLAHPLYLMARGHVGTWDAAYFGLLIVNSLFASGTAFLLFLLTATVLQDVNTGVIAATLYLLNFAVSNLLLAGYVDSGDAQNRPLEGEIGHHVRQAPARDEKLLMQAGQGVAGHARKRVMGGVILHVPAHPAHQRIGAGRAGVLGDRVDMRQAEMLDRVLQLMHGLHHQHRQKPELHRDPASRRDGE